MERKRNMCIWENSWARMYGSKASFNDITSTSILIAELLLSAGI